jgi:hypothetical protein
MAGGDGHGRLPAEGEQMNSLTRIARLTGLLYLIVFSLGIFAELFVRQNLVVPGDAAATFGNIRASEWLFRVALLSDLLRHTLLILLPLALYKLFKSVDKRIALLMAAFGLLGVPIAMVNMLNHLAALLLVGRADYLQALGADQLHAQVMFFLDLYQEGGFVSQFLALWLLALGYLVFKSGFLPRFLGILLMIGCLCYLADVVLFLLAPDIHVSLGLFGFICELLFALWLLIMGVDKEAWERQARRSA